jgi:Ran GTPase-activating protein (RanGAP) involved in mRNA processing and transport
MVVAQAIMESECIISLNLSNNEIRPEGAKVLLNYLAFNNSIIDLNLSSVGVEAKKNRLRADGMKPFKSLLKINKVLTILNVSGNSIGKEGLEYILIGLKENTTLLVLKISKNNLAGDSIESLFKAIKDTNIEELDISKNNIGNTGAVEHIGAVEHTGAEEHTGSLSKCVKLRIINISDIGLTTIGLDVFFEQLSDKEISLQTIICDHVISIFHYLHRMTSKHQNQRNF